MRFATEGSFTTDLDVSVQEATKVIDRLIAGDSGLKRVSAAARELGEQMQEAPIPGSRLARFLTEWPKMSKYSVITTKVTVAGLSPTRSVLKVSTERYAEPPSLWRWGWAVPTGYYQRRATRAGRDLARLVRANAQIS